MPVNAVIADVHGTGEGKKALLPQMKLRIRSKTPDRESASGVGIRREERYAPLIAAPAIATSCSSLTMPRTGTSRSRRNGIRASSPPGCTGHQIDADRRTRRADPKGKDPDRHGQRMETSRGVGRQVVLRPDCRRRVSTGKLVHSISNFRVAARLSINVEQLTGKNAATFDLNRAQIAVNIGENGEAVADVLASVAISINQNIETMPVARLHGPRRNRP